MIRDLEPARRELRRQRQRVEAVERQIVAVERILRRLPGTLAEIPEPDRTTLRARLADALEAYRTT